MKDEEKMIMTAVAPHSPHKNREYFDKQETLEFKKLEENVPEDAVHKFRNFKKSSIGLTKQPSLGTPLNLGKMSPRSDK
jgi:hypothetical protein